MDSSANKVFKLRTCWQTGVSEVRQKQSRAWEKEAESGGLKLWLTLK